MLIVFAVATLVIWAGRIRNIVADDGAVAELVVPGLLVALAVWTLIDRQRVRLLAGVTIAVWAVRVPLVLVRDHEASFKVVHVVLAVVSVVLAVLATREVNRRRRAPGPRRPRPWARA